MFGAPRNKQIWNETKCTLTIHCRNGAVYTVFMDLEDIPYLRQFSWRITMSGKNKTNTRHTFHPYVSCDLGPMHRVLLGLRKGEKLTVDHKDQNTLNNRKENLRIATNRQNLQNRKLTETSTTGYKGVSWSKEKKKFRARCFDSDGRERFIGYYATAEEAAVAVKIARRKWHGEFARDK